MHPELPVIVSSMHVRPNTPGAPWRSGRRLPGKNAAPANWPWPSTWCWPAAPTSDRGWPGN
jgi:hypothetical protein